MQWALTLLASLVRFLEPYLPSMAKFLAGFLLNDNLHTRKSLKAVERANKAASAVDADIDGMRDKWR